MNEIIPYKIDLIVTGKFRLWLNDTVDLKPRYELTETGLVRGEYVICLVNEQEKYVDILAMNNAVTKTGSSFYLTKTFASEFEQPANEQGTMKDKYYQPEVQELHVGMQVEVLLEEKYAADGVDGWHKTGITTFNIQDIIGAPKGKIRVPYLSEQDILSEGWQLESDGVFNIITNSFYKKYALYKQLDGAIQVVTNDGHDITLFCGEIKNINELRFQMKRLGINEGNNRSV